MTDAMPAVKPAPEWQVVRLRSPWPFRQRALRPADISDSLVRVMFRADYHLEDARYTRVVPNRYRVEVSPANYAQQYQPILAQVTRQWTETLLRRLLITNQRRGRKEYRFGGPVVVELGSAEDLQPWEARVLSRIQGSGPAPTEAEPPAARPGTAYLQRLPSGQRFVLAGGVTTLGRDPACTIPLDDPEVRTLRLVSSRHALLRPDGEGFRLYDGDSAGKPSLNGTFVNGQRVGPEGRLLRPGDQVLLAAEDPARPQPGAPGTALFVFGAQEGDGP